jgi:uncharacterized membrane protein YccC
LVSLEVEQARETLAATRAGRSEQARRGEQLLRLLEVGEPSLNILLALEEAVEAPAPERKLPAVQAMVARVGSDYAAIARRVAEVARQPATPPNELQEPERGWRVAVETKPDVPPSVVELVQRLKGLATSAAEAAVAMQRGQPVTNGAGLLAPRGSRARSFLQPLVENLRPQSVVFRHALRIGLVAIAALGITAALGLREEYWVVLSVVAILQPYAVITEERALQRVLGTLLGGTLAAALAAAIGSPLILILVIGVLTAVSVSVLPLNFAAFQILLAPDFMLLATLSHGDLSVVEGRVLGVFIACLLSLAGAWLLWPSPERQHFASAAAHVLRAEGNYVRQLAARRSATVPEVGAARRDLDLSLLDAEASFERLRAEFEGPAHQLEPAMAVLTYSRRSAGSATSLIEQSPELRAYPRLDETAQEVSGRLDALASSLEERQPPAPAPAFEARRELEDPVTMALAERLPQQLEILHRSVERITTEMPSSAYG